MTEPVPGEVADSIVQAALAGISEAELVANLCERLNRAGAALMRSAFASNLLDPTYDARVVVWTRRQGSVEEVIVRDADRSVNESWLGSPFFALLQSGQPMLRRRLDTTYRRGEFSMLDGFQDQGGTDYVAFRQLLGGNVRLGEAQGMVASWTSDARDGFSAAQIALLAGLMPTLTLAIMLQTTQRNARTMIATYLGADAAERVLAGNIVRGRAETIRAVVWYSDLVGFTRISDATSPSMMLALLNDYADAQVQAIEGTAADRGAVRLARASRHRVGGICGSCRRRARAAGKPRPLRDQGRRAAAAFVHHGSRPREGIGIGLVF